MKPFALLALFSLFIVSVAAQARTEKVPKLDVAGSCRDAKIYGMTDPAQTYKNCMLDESDARKELEQHWSKYKPATRRDCLAAGANPAPSYVELLTCIEMTEQTLVPANAGGGGGGAGAVVPGGALGSPSPRPALSPGPRAMPH